MIKFASQHNRSMGEGIQNQPEERQHTKKIRLRREKKKENKDMREQHKGSKNDENGHVFRENAHNIPPTPIPTITKLRPASPSKPKPKFCSSNSVNPSPSRKISNSRKSWQI